MAYDAAAGTVVLSGGYNHGRIRTLDDTGPVYDLGKDKGGGP